MVFGSVIAAWFLLIISISISMVTAVHRRSGRWHMKRISQRSILSGMQRMTHDHDLNFIPKSTTKYPVNIYVVDSGVRISHEEFGNRAELGPDFTDGKRMDCQGHGTSVAALAAGKYSGIARTARIISVRVLDCQGNGYCTDVVKALDWVSQDIRRRNDTNNSNSRSARSVVVMSLGSKDGRCSPTRNQTRNLTRKGVLIFAASGNSRDDSCEVYPGRNDAVIAVGATDAHDRIYKKNNYGKCIDIWAPGVSVIAGWGNLSNTEYKTISGTSFAAPFVAGTAALILGADNTLSAKEVRGILMESSTLNKVRNNSNIGDTMVAGSRFLYTPWAKLFDDVPRNGRQDSDGGKRWTMYDIDIIPRTIPAMTNSARAVQHACTQLNCTRRTIEMRRITRLFKNGSEPRVVRLQFYMRGCDGDINFDQVKRVARENISLRSIRRNVPLPPPIFDSGHSKISFELDSLSIFLLAILGWILLLVIIAFGTGCWKKKLGTANRNRNASKSQDQEEPNSNNSSTNSPAAHSFVPLSPPPQALTAAP